MARKQTPAYGEQIIMSPRVILQSTSSFSSSLHSGAINLKASIKDSGPVMWLPAGAVTSCHLEINWRC
jgi:hypothetical protein